MAMAMAMAMASPASPPPQAPLRSGSGFCCFTPPSQPLLRSLLSFSTSIALLLSHPPAHAATIKMGADDGTLVFLPASLSVPAGEKIVFLNNKGFPHNVIFQKDGVPEGVQAEAISHEDYLNEHGEQYVVTLKEKGAYVYFCSPHQDAKMFGVITVT